MGASPMRLRPEPRMHGRGAHATDGVSLPVLFATILDTIQRFVEAGGYYVIFGLLFACGLGLPLPEDVPLIIGGYFVATGHLHLTILAISAWLGIIGGDCV